MREFCESALPSLLVPPGPPPCRHGAGACPSTSQQTESDLSFLTDDTAKSYTLKAMDTANSSKKSSLNERYSQSNPDLVAVLEQMLEINPYFRPTASQLIESKVFDKIRVPRNEKLEPFSSLKTKVKIDHNEYRYDYEAD